MYNREIQHAPLQLTDDNIYTRIEYIQEDIIRIRIATNPKVPEEESFVLADNPPRLPVTLHSKADEFILSSEKIRMRIQQKPF